MYQGISLQSAPPFGVVVSFFLNAQIYLILAGILLLKMSVLPIDSAINPVIDSGLKGARFIALVHSFSLGFLLFVMFGALSQMLPVLAGIRLKAPKTITFICILSLNLGLLIFLSSFFVRDFSLILIAGICLFIGIYSFIANIFSTIPKHINSTILYIFFALFSLIALSLCGAAMLGVWGGFLNVARYDLIFVAHIVFGAFGWILLLIIGVCLQVLPMFYIAPNFARYKYKFAFPLLFICTLFGGLFAQNLAFLFGGILAFFFGISATLLLAKRKRKIKDLSINLWFVAFFSLALCGVLFVAFGFFELEILRRVGIVAFVFGFVFGAIFAMIYKIVPFLSWFHLSFLGVLEIPNMRDFITPKRQRFGIFSYLFVYLCAILVAIFGEIFYFALGFGLICCGVVSFLNICTAFLKYKNLAKNAK